MAVKKTQGNKVAEQAALFAEVDKKAPGVYAANREKEARVSGGRLPPGIEGGVAQFTDWVMAKTKDDRKTAYLTFTGVVKKPEELAGLQTRYTVWFEDSQDGKTKVADRVDEAMNMAKLLGAELPEGSFKDMPKALDVLKEDGPHFRFRTWQGKATKKYPNPKVKEEWLQSFEYDDDSVEEVVEDSTVTDEEVEETVEEETAEVAEEAVEEVAEETEGEEEVAETEETEEEVEEEVEEEKEFLPKIGDLFRYVPKGQTKPVEIEIKVVYAQKKLVTGVANATGKLYKMIPYDKLASAE